MHSYIPYIHIIIVEEVFQPVCEEHEMSSVDEAMYKSHSLPRSSEANKAGRKSKIESVEPVFHDFSKSINASTLFKSMKAHCVSWQKEALTSWQTTSRDSSTSINFSDTHISCLLFLASSSCPVFLLLLSHSPSALVHFSFLNASLSLSVSLSLSLSREREGESVSDLRFFLNIRTLRRAGQDRIAPKRRLYSIESKNSLPDCDEPHNMFSTEPILMFWPGAQRLRIYI